MSQPLITTSLEKLKVLERVAEAALRNKRAESNVPLAIHDHEDVHALREVNASRDELDEALAAYKELKERMK